MPDDWKTAIVVPIHKKGDVNETNNYRDVSLLSTAYKIYTKVLLSRLEREVEEKGILPEGQAGFRRGRSTMDIIYGLNYIVQKTNRKKEKLYSTFVDLKAASDTVIREKLWIVMEKAGISKYLIERVVTIHSYFAPRLMSLRIAAAHLESALLANFGTERRGTKNLGLSTRNLRPYRTPTTIQRLCSRSRCQRLSV